MKYILLTFCGILLIVFSVYIISALCVSPVKEYTKNNRYYRFLLNFATDICMKVMRIRIYSSGLEKIPADCRYLLICNHRSNFDPIVTWHILKKDDLAFVSKRENFHVPIFGRIIRKCCFMEIDRENPRNALCTIVNAAELIKKDECSVAVYPEGTRSKSGVLLPFHGGVLKIAQKSEVPIVVATIQGTEKIHCNYPWHSTAVYFDVLEVISAEEVKKNRTNWLADNARDRMSRKLSAETEKENGDLSHTL